MLHALHEIWTAMWPNIFAPSVFTVLGITISHFRLMTHANKRHEELKQAVDSDKRNRHLVTPADPSDHSGPPVHLENQTDHQGD